MSRIYGALYGVPDILYHRVRLREGGVIYGLRGWLWGVPTTFLFAWEDLVGFMFTCFEEREWWNALRARCHGKLRVAIGIGDWDD